jgi:hypothetical protein
MKNLDSQYSGRFMGETLGFGGGIGPIGLAGAGYIQVHSPEIGGIGTYEVVSPGYSFNPGLSEFSSSILPKFLSKVDLSMVTLSVAATNYDFLEDTYQIYAKKVNGSWRVTEQEVEQMKNDIRNGINSPWATFGGSLHNQAFSIRERENAIRDLENVWQTHQNYFLFQYDEYKGR